MTATPQSRVRPEEDPNARSVRMTKGAVAYVDASDYEMVSRHSWCLHTRGYAVSRINYAYVLMHRLILVPREGFVTDHISGNKLDNRRSNLRYATPKQSARNTSRHKDSASRFKGVTRRTTKAGEDRWVARVWQDGRLLNLGAYHTEEEAAKAVDLHNASFGEFAKPNLPQGESSGDRHL